ncbi:MAG: energy transducer TonB [Opitutae bacterium]|nr:energy transducer TonB [Opitutae bacterium]
MNRWFHLPSVTLVAWILAGCASQPPPPKPDRGPSSPLFGQLQALDPAKNANDSLPVPIRRIAPNYPIELREKKITGQARVEFIVEPDGSVQLARVVNATHPGFAAPAQQCVLQWKFAPGRKDGVPVRCASEVAIQFALD